MLLASQPPPQIIRAKPQLRVLPLPSQSPQSSPFVRPLQIVAGPNHATSGSSRNCLLAARARMFAVVLSIGAGSMFLVSLDSVVDNLIPVARKYLTELYGSEAEADVAWSWVVSARVYGLAFGCFCAFLLSNCNSRKKPLMASFVINLVGGGLSALICMPGCGIQIACLGRFLSGIGSGLAHIIGAAMLAEIPPIRSRGQALASLTVWACLGELAGMFLSLDSVLGTARTWHLALGFPVLIIPVALIFLAAAPDSPRALLMSGQEEKAFQSLQFYQKSEDWIASLKDIKQELAKQQESGNARRNSAGQERRPLLRTAQQQRRGKGRLLLGSRFVSGKFVRPLLLGAFVLTFAHLDDWLWISYSTQAFENAGLPTAAAQRASLWMSLPQALISLALLFHFDGFPRRQLLILPTLGSILCSLAAICALRLADGGGMAKSLLPCLAALDLCNAAVASESAYSVVPELFPQRDRVMGTALIGILQNMFGGLLTTMALPLMNSHGTEFVLIPFALMNLVYIAVIAKLLPETCGRTFHEISENFSDQLPALFANPVQCLRAAPTMLVNGLRKCVLQTTGCLKR